MVHSINVQTEALRWGNDGVGLKFVLRDPKARNEKQRTAMGANREEMDRFLAGIRKTRGSKA